MAAQNKKEAAPSTLPPAASSSWIACCRLAPRPTSCGLATTDSSAYRCDVRLREGAGLWSGRLDGRSGGSGRGTPQRHAFPRELAFCTRCRLGSATAGGRKVVGDGGFFESAGFIRQLMFREKGNVAALNSESVGR